MPAPHEILANPLTFFLADVGTAFPAIDDEPDDFAVDWEVLGTEGDNNYDGAVSLAHTEETFDFTPSGSTMPVKRFRTAESLLASLNLADVGPNAYAKVMNDAAITTVNFGSGVAGEKSFSLFRGLVVNSFAMLARGVSPVDNDLFMQYEFAKTFVSVNGEVSWNKGAVVALPVQILAVRHSGTDVLICRMGTHEAS